MYIMRRGNVPVCSLYSLSSSSLFPLAKKSPFPRREAVVSYKKIGEEGKTIKRIKAEKWSWIPPRRFREQQNKGGMYVRSKTFVQDYVDCRKVLLSVEDVTNALDRQGFAVVLIPAHSFFFFLSVLVYCLWSFFPDSGLLAARRR